MQNYITQGVTTVVGGNCGGSPLDIGDFLRKVHRKGIALNFGILIGHNTVRKKVMDNENREPTQQELEEMKKLIEDGMKAGALGLSTGLKYIPGAYSKTEEVIELAKVVAKYGGFYASHLREEGLGLIDAVKEAIEIGEKAGVPVEISHHKVVSVDRWGDSKITLKLIDEARSKGIDVKADQYPYPATSTGFTVLFPPWALEGGTQKLIERLNSPQERKKIKEAIKYNIMHDRGGADLSNIRVASFPADSTLEGLSVKDILIKKEKKVNLDNGAELIMDMSIEKGGVSAIYRCLSDKDIERIMKHPAVMHASDGAVITFGKGVPHPRNYGTFPRVLSKYVREKHIIKLKEAIRKMTSLPASMIGAHNRGVIKEGLWADIVIFDPDKIKDKATFDDPHQYPEGIYYVIVNGTVVVEKGKITGKLPGKIIYGPDKKK